MFPMAGVCCALLLWGDAALAMMPKQPTANQQICETEEDLDFDQCRVEDLEIPALRAICERLGWPVQHEHKEDFVTAAYECLLLEQDVHDMVEEGSYPPDILHDKQLTAAVLQDSLERDSTLFQHLMEELEAQQPELFKAITDELSILGQGLDPRGISTILRTR